MPCPAPGGRAQPENTPSLELRRSAVSHRSNLDSTNAAARAAWYLVQDRAHRKHTQPNRSNVNSRVQPFTSVPTPHPLRRLRPSGCPALDDSAGQAPLTPPSPQKSPLRAKWRGEGGTLRPAQRAYAAPLPHFRGQRQHQLAALEDQSGGTLCCRSATAR